MLIQTPLTRNTLSIHSLSFPTYMKSHTHDHLYLTILPTTSHTHHLQLHLSTIPHPSHSPNLPPQPSYPSNSSPISNQRISPVIFSIRFLTSLRSRHRHLLMIRYNRGWARRGGFQGFSVVDSYKNNGGLGTLTKALREPSSMPNMDCVFDCCDIRFKKQRKKPYWWV